MHPKRTTPRVCEVCATPFIALDKSAGRFCSRACYFTDATTKPRTSIKVPAICLECGGTFFAYQWRIDAGRQFCQRACYAKNRRIPVEDRLRNGIDRSGAEGCWPWTLARDPHGYGVISINNKRASTHRVAWTLVAGPIPEGHGVYHVCDNPPCNRNDVEGTYEVDGKSFPRWGHLWLGTQPDNVADMIAKGRKRAHAT